MTYRCTGRNQTMRRSTSLRIAIMSTLAVSFLGVSFSASAGGDCMAKLVGHSYNCTYTDNEGNTGTECVAFSTGGTSTYFDAVYDGSTDYGCACDASGSLDSAKFDASSDIYECSEPSGPALINGKVKG